MVNPQGEAIACEMKILDIRQGVGSSSACPGLRMIHERAKTFSTPAPHQSASFDLICHTPNSNAMVVTSNERGSLPGASSLFPTRRPRLGPSRRRPGTGPVRGGLAAGSANLHSLILFSFDSRLVIVLSLFQCLFSWLFDSQHTCSPSHASSRQWLGCLA